MKNLQVLDEVLTPLERHGILANNSKSVSSWFQI